MPVRIDEIDRKNFYIVLQVDASQSLDEICQKLFGSSKNASFGTAYGKLKSAGGYWSAKLFILDAEALGFRSMFFLS